ncbi:MAG: hypothetical protein ACREIA_25360 [Opitutaceae bacterium]
MTAPPAPVVPLRPLNLGYLQVSLPAEFAGVPVDLDSSRCVTISSEKGSSVAFMSPVLVNDPARRDLLETYAKLAGVPIPAWHEMTKAALLAEPIDL